MKQKNILERYAQEQRWFEQKRREFMVQGELMSVSSMLERAALQHPHQIALLYEDEQLSYHQLYEYAARVQCYLETKISAGDRVLLFMPNSSLFYVAYFAVLQAGGIIVPLNTFLKKPELDSIVADADPRVIICQDELLELCATHHSKLIKSSEVEQIMRMGQKAARVLSRAATDLIALLYTSGTTGTPKGVMLSSVMIITNALQAAARFRLSSAERVFAVLPLFHSFAQNACIWLPFLTGSTVILVPKVDRRKIAAALVHKPTFFVGVPALYGLLCLMRNADLSSVSYFISGGDALPDKIQFYFSLIYRRRICNGYGMTEASPFISVNIDDQLTVAGDVGRPFVGVRVQIKDDAGHILPAGQIGHIYVAGDHIMQGYYNDEQATAAVLQNGWLNTGDLGYVRNTGALVITGREKDLIIHKGFNIYPAEIENILVLHPNVLRAAVIGKLDVDTGEEVIAFVQIRHEDHLCEQQLRTLCRNQLAEYKVPKLFICQLEELPTTATAKVDKKQLRMMLDTL